MGALRRSSFEGEVEGGALPDLRFGPDSTPMPVDDALDDGEADTCALEFPFRMQGLKDAEEPIGVLHIEPDAVVLDEIDIVGLTDLTADGDQGGGSMALERRLTRT